MPHKIPTPTSILACRPTHTQKGESHFFFPFPLSFLSSLIPLPATLTRLISLHRSCLAVLATPPSPSPSWPHRMRRQRPAVLVAPHHTTLAANESCACLPVSRYLLVGQPSALPPPIPGQSTASHRRLLHLESQPRHVMSLPPSKSAWSRSRWAAS